MSFAKNILLLIALPPYGWERIEKDSVPSRVLLSRMFYPMLGVLALTAFARLIYSVNVTVAQCAVGAIIDYVMFFAGYLLSGYVLTSFFPKVAKDADAVNRINTAIVYSMLILVVLNIIDNLLPTPWVFIKIFYLYVLYVAQKSASYLGVPQNDIYLYLMGALVILFPLFVEFVLDRLLSLAAVA